MKKFIVALVALMFLLVVACGGSGCAMAEGEIEEKGPAVSCVESDGKMHILRHDDTGVCYLYVRTGYAGGLTLMVNPDGSPYVWEEENE